MAELTSAIARIRQDYTRARCTDNFRAVVRRTARDLSEIVLIIFKTHDGQLYTRLVNAVRALKGTCSEVVGAMSLKAKLRFRRIRKTRIAVTANASRRMDKSPHSPFIALDVARRDRPLRRLEETFTAQFP